MTRQPSRLPPVNSIAALRESKSGNLDTLSELPYLISQTTPSFLVVSQFLILGGVRQTKSEAGGRIPALRLVAGHWVRKHAWAWIELVRAGVIPKSHQFRLDRT